MYDQLLKYDLQNVKDEERSAKFTEAAEGVRDAVEVHTNVLSKMANDASVSSGIPFLGLDSSAAPAVAITPIPYLFQALGVDHFGATGCVEAAAFLTRIFKSIRGVDLIGFSGLMLTCLEDSGMADAAGKDLYDIKSLLQYSCVCGIGLDCIPVPGDSTADEMAGLMRDCATLSFRYTVSERSPSVFFRHPPPHAPP